MVVSKSRFLMKSLLDFHFNSLQGTYFSEYIKCDGYVLLFSDLVEDAYYNYATQTTKNINEILKDALVMFQNRNRRRAIYVTPDSNVYEDESLIPKGFSKWAEDSWMVLDNPTKLRDFETPLGLTVEKVEFEQRDEYVKVFQMAYGGNNPTDPYANLPVYYSQSLRRSFENTPSGYKMECYWARIKGKPVGIAQMFWNDTIAGVYGVGTIEEFRKQGVGICIMSHLTKLAIAQKIPTIMLQTETGSKVEQWYIHMGFKTIFTASYYVES